MLRILGNLAIAVVSLTLALLLVEGAIRTVGLPPQFGRLLNLYGAATREVDGTVLWKVQDHQARYRDEDLDRIEHSQDAFIILGLGDSIMFGVDNPLEDTYLEQTRQHLIERAERPVEILNLAVPGYNTAQENAVHDEISRRIDADLVIVHYWADDSRQYRLVGGHIVDVGDMLEDGNVIQALPLPRALNDFLLVHSKLYALLTHVVVSSHIVAQPNDFSRVAEPLLSLHRRVQAGGGRLLVLVSSELGGAEPKTLLEFESVRELGREHGFQVVDVTTWLTGVASQDIAQDACHFNAKGHQILGRHLADLLLANYLR